MVRQAVLLNLTHAPTTGRRGWAGVPLLLRGLLVAQKAGVEEVLLLGGADPSRWLHDQRVKLRWRWLPADSPGDERAALAAARGQVSEDFILLFADSICGDRALAALRQAELGGELARVAGPPRGGGRHWGGCARGSSGGNSPASPSTPARARCRKRPALTFAARRCSTRSRKRRGSFAAWTSSPPRAPAAGGPERGEAGRGARRRARAPPRPRGAGAPRHGRSRGTPLGPHHRHGQARGH